MTPFRRRDAGHVNEVRFPNMTPMVDIVMVILIFFMASTTFIGDDWFLRSVLGSDAPADTTEPSLDLPPVRLDVTLDVDRAGATIASGVGLSGVSLSQLEDALRQFAEGTAVEQIVVVLKPASGVPYLEVVRLHDICEGLGIGRVGIAVDAAPGDGDADG